MKLIDADEMQEWAFQFNFDGRITERELFLFNRAIEEMPTVDAVPVVRCKECEYWDDEFCRVKSVPYFTYADDYCSDAERRNDETD